MSRTIESIGGFEPPRDGEYPDYFRIGVKPGLQDWTVGRIEENPDTGRFNVFDLDGFMRVSMTPNAVAIIHYLKPEGSKVHELNDSELARRLGIARDCCNTLAEQVLAGETVDARNTAENWRARWAALCPPEKEDV